MANVKKVGLKYYHIQVANVAKKRYIYVVTQTNIRREKMDAMQFMVRFSELAGETAPVVLFSALRISEHFEITIHAARVIVKTLREANLVKRVGNQYMFNVHGFIVARELLAAKEEVF